MRDDTTNASYLDSDAVQEAIGWKVGRLMIRRIRERAQLTMSHQVNLRQPLPL